MNNSQDPETASPQNHLTSAYLVDSHVHLDDPDFEADRSAVIDRARAAGVRYIMVAGGGTGPDRLDSPLAIADSYDWIYASIGVHPHEAQQFTDSHAEKILHLGRHPKVIAVGEIGLDYHYDKPPRDVQMRVLIRQMELAKELKLPIMIHCRDAWADLREAISAHWKSTGLGGILHCFTGSQDDARALIDAGFLISFAGNLTYKKSADLREVAPYIPLDRLLTETDSPYLAPIPHRGKRNEPAFVRIVTQEFARLRIMAEEDLARQVLANFEKLLPSRSGTSRAPDSRPSL
jgi:TatD DNase family protein